MQNLEVIKITQDNEFKFELKNSFSYIKINRIVVSSLSNIDPSLWMNHLSSFNLVFSYSSKRGYSKTIPINLLAYISPYHKHPMIEFPNLVIPEENVKNFTSLGDYYKDLVIKIEPIGNDTNKVQLDIFYESSPGVLLKK